jgi:SAM-dependent methyltransferase
LTDASATATGEHASLLEFAVLRDQSQILDATANLQRRGLLGPAPEEDLRQRLRRRLRRDPDPALVAKTWDVERAVDAFAGRLDPSDPILDMGCFACDVLPALKRLGYGNLAGIDFNPAVLEMPYADVIDYKVGDLLSTPWPDGHFAGITAISVIEHGVPDEELCSEISRLLRPGGVFLFTTDYWPQKIATTERMFNLDWRIFDQAEIEALLAVAARHDLHPISDPRSVIRDTSSPPIHFAGKDYTFLYGAFIRGED